MQSLSNVGLRCCAAAACVLAAASAAGAAPGAPATKAAAAPRCHALLLGGLPGTPIHARHYRDWLARFRALLADQAKRHKARLGKVICLSGEEAFKAPFVRARATAASIDKALAELAAAARADDQLVLFMVGLGVRTGKVPSFVVPGPDIDARRLAGALAAVPARNQVVLNFTSTAGDATLFLSRKGRVVVSANMPTEHVPPVYAEFFLRGLESRRADGEGAPGAGKKDGTITLLEAYNWATFHTAQWIARQKRTGENTWRLDGRESVAIFKKLYVTDKPLPGSRRLDPASNAARDDEIVRLKVKGADDTAIYRAHRRVITEHAALEDCGEQEPVSALSDEKKDYVALDGLDEPEPGWLARRTVLGRPRRLTTAGR